MVDTERKKRQFIKGIHSTGRCSWLGLVWDMSFIGFSNSKTILLSWSHLPHSVGCRPSLQESRIRLLTFS